MAFVAAYSLLVAEGFVRLFHPVAMFPRNVVPTEWGVRGNKPSMSYVHTSPDVRVTFNINSKGVRADREIPYEKPPNVVRIVALGDSFGVGYEVNLPDSFLTHLEQNLRAKGIPAEVVNLSVSGQGTSEELVTLRAEGFKYHPDLVLVCWHPTDLEDNVRSGLFALRDGQLVKTAATYLPGVSIRNKLERIWLYRFLEEDSQLYGFVRESLAGSVKDLLLSGQSGAADAGEEGGAAPPAALPKAAAAPSDQPLTPADELAVALLKQLQADAAEHGSELLVLDIPDRLNRTEFRSRFPRDPQGQSFGFHLLSPLALFRAQHGALIYNERSHFHFTPLATALVGQALADAVVADGLLKKP